MLALCQEVACETGEIALKLAQGGDGELQGRDKRGSPQHSLGR